MGNVCPPSSSDFSVLTFNVHHESHKDPQPNLQAIIDSNADIICLQETNYEWHLELQKDQKLNALYPHSHYHEDQWTEGGYVVLSKFPICEPKTLPKHSSWWYGALKIFVVIKETKIQLLNLHLRAPMTDSGNFVMGYFSPEVKAKRAEEAHHFGQHLDNDVPTIVLGDFNENENGQSHCYFVENHQLHNSVIKVNGRTSPTWFYAANFLQLSYDHILYSPKFLTPKAAHVIPSGKCGNSDHRPVLAWFDLKDQVKKEETKGKIKDEKEEKE